MTRHAVVIAGAGPTGLMLAGELALAGVDVAIVERRLDQQIAGTRAGGLQSRTLEMFDLRGIAQRFLAEGKIAQVHGFGHMRLNISDLPTRHAYGLGLWQNHIERILGAWVAELRVPIYRGREVVGFTQDDDGVSIGLSNGETLAAQYFIGCDGGRSLVRKAAGIDFPGSDATTSNLIAEVELTGKPELGVHRTPRGIYSFGKRDYEIRDGQIIYKDGGPYGVMMPETLPVPDREPTLQDLREAMVAMCGTDYGVHSPISISRFSDMARQAASYRAGRVLLAGDAAHVHSPVGGKGLNAGVQDAMNLGWKLAAVVKGEAPESLLDTYHAERHPVGAGVLRSTMAQVALLRTDERTEALREKMSVLFAMEEPRRTFGAMAAGLDIHYDLGPGHALLGRRMPDLDLVVCGEPMRLSALMHKAQPVLLNFGAPGAFDIARWADRVQLVYATCESAWELPVIGAVDAPAAVLIRPDGYVAWVGDGTQGGLADALTTWCGPAG